MNSTPFVAPFDASPEEVPAIEAEKMTAKFGAREYQNEDDDTRLRKRGVFSPRARNPTTRSGQFEWEAPWTQPKQSRVSRFAKRLPATTIRATAVASPNSSRRFPGHGWGPGD